MMWQHTSTLAEREPDWGSVDKTKLPRACFAEVASATKAESAHAEGGEVDLSAEASAKAGKKSTCSHCQKPLSVPAPEETGLDDLELAPTEADPTSKTDILPAQRPESGVGESTQAQGAGAGEESWVHSYRRTRAARRRESRLFKPIIIALVVLAIVIAIIALVYLL